MARGYMGLVMPLTECFPSSFGVRPTSSVEGTMHCILLDAWCPIPVGPVAGGDVQRFAEAVDSAGLAVAAVSTSCSEWRAAR